MDGKVHAIGSVAFTAGSPAFVANNGAFSATITDTGTGNIGLNMADGYAIDSTQCAVVCTARATLAASGLVAFGVAHTSDVIKQVTILQEAAMGAASALADVNFDVAILRVEIV